MSVRVHSLNPCIYCGRQPRQLHATSCFTQAGHIPGCTPNWNPNRDPFHRSSSFNAGDRYFTGSSYDSCRPQPPSPLFPDIFSCSNLAPSLSDLPEGILGRMDDIITYWGPYNTFAEVRASTFYARFDIPVNPRLYEQWRQDVLSPPSLYPAIPPPDLSMATFTLHSVLPIPVRYLSQMSSFQLKYLAACLNDQDYEEHERFLRGDAVGEGYAETFKRLSTTLKRIHRICEERLHEAVDDRRSMLTGFPEIFDTFQPSQEGRIYAQRANELRGAGARGRRPIPPPPLSYSRSTTPPRHFSSPSRSTSPPLRPGKRGVFPFSNLFGTSFRAPPPRQSRQDFDPYGPLGPFYYYSGYAPERLGYSHRANSRARDNRSPERGQRERLRGRSQAFSSTNSDSAWSEPSQRAFRGRTSPHAGSLITMSLDPRDLHALERIARVGYLDSSALRAIRRITRSRRHSNTRPRSKTTSPAARHASVSPARGPEHRRDCPPATSACVTDRKVPELCPSDASNAVSNQRGAPKRKVSVHVSENDRRHGEPGTEALNAKGPHHGGSAVTDEPEVSDSGEGHSESAGRVPRATNRPTAYVTDGESGSQ